MTQFKYPCLTESLSELPRGTCQYGRRVISWLGSAIPLSFGTFLFFAVGWLRFIRRSLVLCQERGSYRLNTALYKTMAENSRRRKRTKHSSSNPPMVLWEMGESEQRGPPVGSASQAATCHSIMGWLGEIQSVTSHVKHP